MTAPCRPAADGFVIAVRVTPRSSRDEIAGLSNGSNGELSLAVKVRAQPEQGRANKAVIELLAEALGISKSRLSLLSGAGSRRKTILAAGDPAELELRLADLVKTS